MSWSHSLVARGIRVTTSVPANVSAAEKKDLDLQKFMETMRRRFRLSADAENESRVEQADDRAFRASKQWDEATLEERSKDKRPCMTINRIPQFLSQVTNQARASKPSITVVPLGGGARVETASIIQGLIRDIEMKSDADIAYMTAADSQAEIGLGYIKVDTELVDSDDGSPSFDSEPRIRRVRNRFSIYMDPSCQEFDASDSRFCFQVEDLTPDEFESRYGDKQTASLEEFSSIGDNKLLWMPGGSVRVAHYWYVEEVPIKILSIRFPDGTKAILAEDSIDLTLAGATVEGSRIKLKRVVRSCIVNGLGILDGADDTGIQGAIWPSKYIPIVPVIGNEVLLDGKVDYRGMVRDAKEPQRAYNFWVTATVETVALAPKAPWVMADGQDENYEDQWDQANVKNFSRLVYTPVSVGGVLAPSPHRDVAEPPIMAMSSLIRQADNDLKATMGFYDASLGQTGPEQSGKAILARQKQGEIGNSQYLDNLSRSIRQVGRICLDLIGSLYDTQRIIRIIGDDGKPAMVQHDPEAGAMPETENVPEGIKSIVNLTAGRYDVTITVGPSFLSRRQEAVAQMGELMGQNPSLAQVLADLWISNMDAPWAAEAAKRLKRMVPAGVLDPEDGGDQTPPEATQKIQELSQQLEQAAEMVKQLQQEIAVAEQRLAAKDVEASARIEAEQIRATAMERITRMELDAKAHLQALENEVKVVLAEIKTGQQRESEVIRARAAAAKQVGQAATQQARPIRKRP